MFRHWEGLARPDEADALAATHGGTARRVIGNDAGLADAALEEATAAGAAE